jgi:hypothetical protein
MGPSSLFLLFSASVNCYVDFNEVVLKKEKKKKKKKKGVEFFYSTRIFHFMAELWPANVFGGLRRNFGVRLYFFLIFKY